MAGTSNSGRETLLTKHVIKKACKYVADGNYITTVCDYLNICKATYHNWIVRGKEDKENGVTDSIYLEFLDGIKKAESEAIMRNVECIQASVNKGNVDAAKWFLSKKKPEDWGDKMRMEHSGSVSIDISKLDFTKIPNELLDDIIKKNGVINNDQLQQLQQLQNSADTFASEA